MTTVVQNVVQNVEAILAHNMEIPMRCTSHDQRVVLG